MATDDTIDKVQIEITASADKANKTIEELEKNMRNLKSSMTGFNTSSLDNLVSKLDKISASLDRIVNKSQAVSKTSVAPKVDTSNMTKAEKDIQKSTQKISESLAGLKAYGNAAMGGDTSALFSFDRNATKIQSQIDVLKEKLKGLGDTRVKSDAFLQLEQDISKASNLLDALKQKNQDVYGGNAAPNDSNYVRLQDNIQKVSDILDGLIDKQRTMIQDGSAYTDPFQGYRDSVETLQSQLDDAKTRVHDAVASMNSTPINIDTEPSISALDRFKASLSDTSNKLLGIVGTGITSGFRNLSSNISKLASDMSKLHSKTSNVTGGFKKGFVTVLKYGFGIRSLYVLFRRLRKAVTESFGELQKSGAFIEETKTNIEGLKASLTTLKFQFGAAFQPIFNAVAPALQTLIDYLVKVMNIISAFTAKLMGKSTYSKAVATTAAIADNVGGAAKSAKELNKQLQGFDELNNLTTNAGGNGGGGGGGAGDTSGANYVTENVDSVLGDFAKELANKIKDGDWEGLGETISNKLTEVMNGIPWNSIYQKASNFGKGLAEFLNGLISPELFSALGGTIAGAINTALEFLNSFGETFEWTEFGKSIAAGINKFFKDTKFGLAGDTIHTWVAGILDAGFALLTDTDFAQIGEKLAEFLNGLKVADLAIKLVKCAKALVGGIATAIESLWENSDVTTKISLAVVGLFAALKLTGLSTTIATSIGSYLVSNPILIGKAAVAIATFTVTFEGAKWLFGNIADDFDKELASYYKNFTWTEFIETIMKPDGSGVDWQEIKKAWNDMMDDYFKPLFDEVSSWVDVGKNIVEGIKSGILEKLNSIGTWIKEKFQTIIDKVKEFFGIKSPSTKFEEIGGYCIDGLKEGFTNALSGIKDWLKTNVVDKVLGAVDGIKNIVVTIKGAVDSTFDTVKEKWDSVKSKLETLTTEAKEKAGYLISTLKSKWDEGWTTTKELFTEAKEKAGYLISTLKSKWDEGWTTTKELFTEAKEKAGYLISTIKDTWDTGWTTVKELFTKTAEDPNYLISTVKSAWDDGWTTTKELVTEAKEKAENTISGLKQKWDDWKAGVKSLFTKAEETKGSEISVIQTTWTNFVNNPGVANLVAKAPTYEQISEAVDKLKKSLTKNLKTTIETKLKKPSSKNRKSVKKTISDWKDGINKTITMKLDVTSNVGSLASWVNNNIIYPINKTMNDVAKKTKTTYTPIQGLAKGGYADSATSVIFGEDGGEAIIPLEHNLGAINKIASVMLDGMSDVMKYRSLASPSSLGFSGTVHNSASGVTSSANSNEMIAEQNRLLSEQNRLLQQILQKPSGITRREVFTAVQQESQNYYNRTGNAPFLS